MRCVPNFHEFTITASDPDGDDLSYTANNLPTGATFDPVNQKFSWMTGSADVGNYTVEFTVTDDGSPPLNDSETVTIVVETVNGISPAADGDSDDSGGGGGGGTCFLSSLSQ